MNELLQKLIEILGLPTDSTQEEALAQVQANKKDAEAFREANPDMVAALVMQAVREQKIYDHEREWFANLASEDYLVARSFVKRRGKVYPSLLAAIQRTKPIVAMSDVQAKINAQLGISAETFIKYNP